MKRNVILLFVLQLFILSCKKESLVSTVENVSQAPTLLTNNSFPGGVLKFSSKENLNTYLTNIENQKTLNVQGFKSFKNSYEEYKNGKINSNTIANSTSKISTNTLNSIGVDEVDESEYLYDLNQYALPSEVYQYVVNSDLQVIVGDNLYQFTRLGMFEVNLNSLNNYNNAVSDNLDAINTDPTYVSIPNEVSIGNDTYLVSDGIIRYASIGEDILTQEQNIQNVASTSNPVVNENSNNVETHSVSSDFGIMMGKHFSIYFNDFANRRLVFGVENIKINALGFGFNQVSIGSKVQREKSFLGIHYWGPSYADEIIVGCDNMDIEADAVFPYPNNFSTIYRPKLEEIANYSVGGKVLSILGITVNLSALNYSLSNDQISTFINGQYNKFVNNQYTNLFKSIENNLITSIDPTYVSRYGDYTKRITYLNSQNKLHWVFGQAENATGYSHSHTWIFDNNVGGSFKINGGVGGTALNYYYPYKIIKGSFYGKARFGNIWRMVRIIVS
jgi:hypothetical protein